MHRRVARLPAAHGLLDFLAPRASTALLQKPVTSSAGPSRQSLHSSAARGQAQSALSSSPTPERASDATNIFVGASSSRTKLTNIQVRNFNQTLSSLRVAFLESDLRAIWTHYNALKKTNMLAFVNSRDTSDLARIVQLSMTNREHVPLSPDSESVDPIWLDMVQELSSFAALHGLEEPGKALLILLVKDRKSVV